MTSSAQHRPLVRTDQVQSLTAPSMFILKGIIRKKKKENLETYIPIHIN